jgi:AraC family transcriptional regulator
MNKNDLILKRDSMDNPVATLFPLTPAGLERHMPMPPVCTSDGLYPGWDKLRICLYRLPPSRITLPPGQTLRIVVQLSSRSMNLERDMNGVTRVAKPSLDAININPAFQAINWQWDNFMEFVQIQITPAFLAQMEADHGVLADRIIRLERFSVHDAMIAQIGHEMADIFEGRRPKVDVPYLDALAVFLVLHLWNRYCGVEPVPEAAKHGPDFHRIVDFIHSNLDKDLRLEQIARMANLSNFYFIRLFKAAFDKTPHQYILDCRINQAKELLLGSFLPISEVSQRCGFSTQSHFTSAFRQSTGNSPRAFRQSHAKAASPGR